MSPQSTLHPETFNRLAQRTLFAFVVSFIIARVVDFLIWGFLVLVIVLIGFGATLGWASGPLSAVVGPKLREFELSSTP